MIKLMTLCSLLCMHSFGFAQKSGELVGVTKPYKPLNAAKEAPKDWRLFFGDMVYIPAGTAQLGSEEYIDSLISMRKRQVSISAFYMSTKEVTNIQYRTFCQMMLAEVGKDSAKWFLPDTTCWNKIGGDNGPMVTYYFSHPAYDYYPVVGVSYPQAMAYAAWLNKQLQSNPELSAFASKGLLLGVNLPTEMEWEYAAKGSNRERALYPWSGGYYQIQKNGSFIPMANGGSVRDEHKFAVFDYGQDGGFYTTKVGMYPANNFGLFDMAGNVNEWVLDDFVAENQPVDIELLPRRKNAGVDEKRVTTSKVIKGGGYLDAPYFLTLGSRRAMAPTEQRADLGFRIVMTISSSSGSNAY